MESDDIDLTKINLLHFFELAKFGTCTITDVNIICVLSGRRLQRLVHYVLVWRARRLSDGQRTKKDGSLGGATSVARRRHFGESTEAIETNWSIIISGGYT